MTRRSHTNDVHLGGHRSHIFGNGEVDPFSRAYSNKSSSKPTVLHAAVLDQRIAAVSLEGCLSDWVSVVRTPISLNQMGNVVQGALEVADLPDLASLIAPRSLSIRSPVDARGDPLSGKTMEQIFGVVREAYRRAKASDRLSLEAGSR